MNKTTGYIALILSIIACVAILLGGFSHKTASVGGTTNYDTIGATGLQIGVGCNNSLGTCQGTTLSQVISGTCNPTFYGTSLAATSTGVFACASTNVLAGDKVFVMLPSGAGAATAAGAAASPYGGFNANAGFATTTGIFAFNIQNLTGAATTSFTQATTAVQYVIIR
jgi:hypothetical protein